MPRASDLQSSSSSSKDPSLDDVVLVRLPARSGASRAATSVFEIQNVLSPDACPRAGRTTDRGVSLPTQDVMVSSLPQQSQDEIRNALELTARRVSMELTGVTLEFTMSRAFVIVYDAARQKGLKKHTDGRKEGATLLLLISKPNRDFEGGGTRFFPSVLESSFDAKPALGSTIVFPSDTLQHEGIPIKRGRRLLVCVFATKKKIGGGALGPGDSKAIDTIQPASSTHEKASSHGKSKYGMMNDDQVLSQECACTIS
ncbi:hypothetical protein AURANDRAFT_64723 [Aureococcus anophagefferens]|uniref:Fe2OG dioxygenase domain-containing protein n=1 Tax=Aureococcus anophagefferens TaxID=44056 RepID=F0YB82_AURAN|nr:hypothetical protein AURANDRAFT_64723 [Aureococcus anophagefferens]EGB07613.1 hypothetical protein AURANDRAFT_64723 [Aureococcus anophagefferens]|eukprot:XP_009037611.1 hypothetical protein AURANDRAFT_64723 [Aureococcus anophagefferens]